MRHRNHNHKTKIYSLLYKTWEVQTCITSYNRRRFASPFFFFFSFFPLPWRMQKIRITKRKIYTTLQSLQLPKINSCIQTYAKHVIPSFWRHLDTFYKNADGLELGRWIQWAGLTSGLHNDKKTKWFHKWMESQAVAGLPLNPYPSTLIPPTILMKKNKENYRDTSVQQYPLRKILRLSTLSVWCVMGAQDAALFSLPFLYFFGHSTHEDTTDHKIIPKSIHTYKHWGMINNKKPLVSASTVSSLHCTIPQHSNNDNNNTGANVQRNEDLLVMHPDIQLSLPALCLHLA